MGGRCWPGATVYSKHTPVFCKRLSIWFQVSSKKWRGTFCCRGTLGKCWRCSWNPRAGPSKCAAQCKT